MHRDCIRWPATRDIVLPRDVQERDPDPIAYLLGWAARPWVLASIAEVLRGAGEVEIPRKTEAELAAALHWLVGLAVQHGERWHEAYEDEIRALQVRFANRRAAGHD